MTMKIKETFGKMQVHEQHPEDQSDKQAGTFWIWRTVGAVL